MIWDEFLRHFRFCDEEDSGLSDEEQERKGPKNRPKHTRKRIHQAKKNFLEKFKTASKKKDKKSFGKVESAFLKDNTDVYDVSFQTDKSIKIKIEVDTQPPLNFRTEQKLLLQPHSFMTRCFTLPDLFAGKIHALVYRGWKNRVKGRDWYDFEWYVRHNVSLDFTHLAERSKQFNNENITPELFKEKLIERLSTADIKQVKEDVLPFVRNLKELDIWSNDYFVQLADMMKFE